MKIHIFQHAHFESPGNTLDLVNNQTNSITYTHFYEDFELPQFSDIDMLIILGGPMSIHDEDRYPWLKAEKEFIKKAIKLGKKVFGICLGSQMLANVLGADVYPNNQKEIGWFNIQKENTDKSNLISNFPDEALAFHWHGDTFNIPDGATRIYSSQATKNQGFIYGDNVMALQFHWELEHVNVEKLIEYSGGDITEGKFIQSPDQLLSNPTGFSTNKEFMKVVLDYFGV